MPLKSWLKLLVLAWPLITSAYADSNLAGDEITISGDGSKLQSDPVAGYLPDTTATASAAGDSQVGDDLWQRIKDGYAMPELQSEYTASHESWYAARPDYVKRMVARSQRYLFHVVEEVQKRGMPTEIALLPMIESAFNPQAYSRSHASGIWQFVPSTGKDFGLKQNWWVDNRRDITAATNAALNYLQKLHVMFGTWDLALAAYNAGEGTVMRAIERNRSRGLPTDYQSLPLPVETKNYVPKLQAMKNIVNHPEEYGLEIASIANRPYFTKVTAPEQIDARLASQLAEIPFEEFSSLNPEYNRPVLTSNGNVHEILLPVGTAQVFSNNLANYDKPLVSWQTYYARRGERMDQIAKKFGISLARLRDINDLPTRNKVTNTQVILVPGKGDNLQVAETQPPAPVEIEPAAKNSVRQSGKAKLASKRKVYIVKRGDTLQSIARKFDIALSDLQRWNKMNGTHIMPGHKLTITAPDAA